MYRCDICTNTFPSQADGTFFDQQRVLTSPGYWEKCYRRPEFQDAMLGLFLSQFCQDRSGFTVCDECTSMLGQDGVKAAGYGLPAPESNPSGHVSSYKAGMAAGTVWKAKNGSWPTTIQIGGSSNPAGALSFEDDKKTSGCFVATAVFGDADALEVRRLRAFRDRRLLHSRPGRLFVRTYHRVGPGLARLVGAVPPLRGLARAILRPIAWLCREGRGRG